MPALSGLMVSDAIGTMLVPAGVTRHPGIAVVPCALLRIRRDVRG
jgi:hypothetical protein